jgi:adenylate kinase family enzyme
MAVPIFRGLSKMNSHHIQRIMVFGRPGGGKSTFATWASQSLGLPLHHLDKHFYVSHWIERDYNDFLAIQQHIVETQSWIVDGNSIRSLEMRWSRADLVLYFNLPKLVCLYRVIKRFFRPNKHFDDRAPQCP